MSSRCLRSSHHCIHQHTCIAHKPPINSSPSNSKERPRPLSTEKGCSRNKLQTVHQHRQPSGPVDPLCANCQRLTLDLNDMTNKRKQLLAKFQTLNGQLNRLRQCLKSGQQRLAIQIQKNDRLNKQNSKLKDSRGNSDRNHQQLIKLKSQNQRLLNQNSKKKKEIQNLHKDLKDYKLNSQLELNKAQKAFRSQKDILLAQIAKLNQMSDQDHKLHLKKGTDIQNFKLTLQNEKTEMLRHIEQLKNQLSAKEKQNDKLQLKLDSVSKQSIEWEKKFNLQLFQNERRRQIQGTLLDNIHSIVPTQSTPQPLTLNSHSQPISQTNAQLPVQPSFPAQITSQQIINKKRQQPTRQQPVIRKAPQPYQPSQSKPIQSVTQKTVLTTQTKVQRRTEQQSSQFQRIIREQNGELMRVIKENNELKVQNGRMRVQIKNCGCSQSTSSLRSK